MIGTYVELRDQALRVENALRQVLERQEVWHCNRVWEAWAVDTMSRDDFSLVTEDPVAIEELVQAVMSVSGAATVSNAATEKRSSAKIADLVYENAKLKAERDAALAAAGVTTQEPGERDAALARIAKAEALHRRYGIFELEDSCPDTSDEHREEHHHECADEVGEFYCAQMQIGAVCDECRTEDGERVDWPCATMRALTEGENE